MTMTHLMVDVSTLRAALTHSADADVRYYLNGVYFDLTSGHVVATDGSRMYAAHLGEGHWSRGMAFIVPNDVITLALKGHSRYLPQIDVSHDDRTGAVTVGTVSGKAIDGRFPDWRRVVPRGDGDANGEWTPVDPEYLTDAMRALDITAGGSGKRSKGGSKTLFACDVHYHGAGNAVVVTREGVGALVVVMPMCNEMPTERGKKVAAILASPASVLS
jgi:DNA polymerase-3 subunit beta